MVRDFRRLVASVFFALVGWSEALSAVAGSNREVAATEFVRIQHRHRHFAFCTPATKPRPRGRKRHVPRHGAVKSTSTRMMGSTRISAHKREEVPAANDRSSMEEELLRRRYVAEGLISSCTRVVFIGLGLSFRGTGSLLPGHAEELDESALEEYTSPDGTFALRYPRGFKGYSKPLKTHKMEVNFKSEEVKGYEVGVAVDPVKIESLEKFGTPEEVGARVIRVEQAKDGTLDTKLLGAMAEKQGDLSLYTLDYFVESTRGFKHFVAKVTIKDNLLYACTAQAKQNDYPQVEQELRRIVGSFRVPG